MHDTPFLFDAGHVVRTARARCAMLRRGVSECGLLERHKRGDFGDVGPAQCLDNRRAIASGGRVFSAYRIGAETILWIVTDIDRRSTSVMTPCEHLQRLRTDGAAPSSAARTPRPQAAEPATA